MGEFIKKYSDLSDPIDTPGVLGTGTIYDGVLGYTTANEQKGLPVLVMKVMGMEYIAEVQTVMAFMVIAQLNFIVEFLS